MRKEKRFTPRMLERFEKNNRSTGTFEKYTAFHQVTRGDPSSSGLSHILTWNGRQRDLLSNGELDTTFFVCLLPNLVDACEQFKLSLHDAPHEMCRYDARHGGHFYPGTESLAKRLKIRHPMTYGGGKSASWRMTSDHFLLCFRPDGQMEILVFAFKPDPDTSKLSPRKRQLLHLEKSYWEERGATWLLITPSLYDEMVALTLRCTAQWILCESASAEAMQLAARVAHSFERHSLTVVYRQIEKEIGNLHQAQCAFWQAVWSGQLCLDLRRGWRPDEQMVLLDEAAFQAQNPILSRRTAWI